ncbi:MAG: 4Fe-4S binding protein [Elusimicrobiota bacterium]|jgi:ferredoxin|nr:4Fe-4S binding protein [Elusimicrobiota bacterium]
MAKKIDSELCVGCGACAAVCPTEAIVLDGPKYKVDEDKCIDCGSCEGQCAVNAIS